MPKTNEGTAGNADLTKETKTVALTQEQFDAETARIKLEMLQYELEEKKLNLADIKDRLAEREMRRESVGQRAKTNGATLATLKRNREASQERCNHRKGGNGAEGVVGGQGDDPQFAVLKHKMANGDWWIRCLRCGKWWRPPMEEEYETHEGYVGALAEYKMALNFPTRNSPSTSIAFQWGDGGKYFRQVMKETTNI